MAMNGGRAPAGPVAAGLRGGWTFACTTRPATDGAVSAYGSGSRDGSTSGAAVPERGGRVVEPVVGSRTTSPSPCTAEPATEASRVPSETSTGSQTVRPVGTSRSSAVTGSRTARRDRSAPGWQAMVPSVSSAYQL